MAKLTNDVMVNSYWKKAYMFEFYTGTKTECFTFSLPPQSEDFSTTERISKTKTFSGLFVEEYGLDASHIVLSGTTVNNSLKKIYRPGESDKWLTGEEEISELDRLIRKYKTGSDTRNQKVLLYDLSKASSPTRRTSVRYWQVFFNSFSYKRTKDKPFAYDYTIDMDGASVSATSKKYPVWGNFDINKIVAASNAICDKVSSFMSWTDTVSDYADQAKDALTAVDEITGTWMNTITNATSDISMLIQNYTSVVDQGINLCSAAVNKSSQLVALVQKSLLEAPPDIVQKYGTDWENVCDNWKLSMDTLQNNSTKLSAAWKSFGDNQ